MRSGASITEGSKDRLSLLDGRKARALSERSTDEINWPTGYEALDVVDQLVSERLLGLLTCPCNMRRDDHVTPFGDAHPRTVSRRRLRQRDVDAGAADQPLLECLLQVLLSYG